MNAQDMTREMVRMVSTLAALSAGVSLTLGAFVVGVAALFG
jgi:hypothetical protein